MLKQLQETTLVGQCQAVRGTAVCGHMLNPPGMRIKVADEFFNEFCRHLLKRELVAAHAAARTELADQVSIRH